MRGILDAENIFLSYAQINFMRNKINFSIERISIFWRGVLENRFMGAGTFFFFFFFFGGKGRFKIEDFRNCVEHKMHDSRKLGPPL